MTVIDRTIVTILVVLILDNMTYGISEPFLPSNFEGKGISGTMIGLTQGSFAIAYMITAPLFGFFVNRVGHRNMIVMGLLLLSLSTAAFGAIEYLKTTQQILGISITLRVLQGIASCMINTASYSYAAQAYGNDVEKVVSLFEGFIGFGTTSGGVLGGLVYNALGFEKTFYVFGVIYVPLAIVVRFLVRTPK